MLALLIKYVMLYITYFTFNISKKKKKPPFSMNNEFPD